MARQEKSLGWERALLRDDTSRRLSEEDSRCRVGGVRPDERLDAVEDQVEDQAGCCVLNPLERVGCTCWETGEKRVADKCLD